MTLLSLGVDQSTTATGLCLISFERGQPGGYGNKWQPVRCATAETPDYGLMISAVTEFLGLDTPAVCCAEWGYVGVNVASAFTTIQTATWVGCLMHHYYTQAQMYAVPACEWRDKVWYMGAGRMKRDTAKEYSMNFARTAAGLSLANDHEGDALGLAIAGMYKYLESLEQEQTT